MTVLYHLQEIRKKLTPPKSWTKDAVARNAKREAVDSTNPDAVCWCIIGAVNCVVHDVADFPVACAIMATIADLHPRYASFFQSRQPTAGVPCFNDAPTTTHKDVLAVLDEAIRRQTQLENPQS